MNISAPFIKRPVMTTFVMISLFLVGVLSYFQLPVTDVPSISYPHIRVYTSYPGASPETVLYQITTPLEKELGLIKGVREISSKSCQGSSSISLSFDCSCDMKQAAVDVQTALHRVEGFLPEDLEHGPTYSLREENQEPIMDLIITSSEMDVDSLRQIAERYVAPRLERIEGIAQVDLWGETKSIWLRINPLRMAARGITFDQVVEAVQRSTSYTPLGSIQTGSAELCVEWPSTIVQPQDLETVRINGVFLKEIGEISEKGLSPHEDRFVTKKDSQNAVILFVQKTSEANAVFISNAVKKSFEQLRKELPQTISLNIWFDKATWIQSSLTDVTWSLCIAFFLVTVVIYWSIRRFTDSLITSVTLPLALLGTLAVMACVHFSLDLLSLLALTLSCGFVVDDAIVVLENIVRFREQGKSAREASLLGSEQICFTILSITLSLVAVFIPILFMQGMEGKLFREFSCTLAIAIVVSGVVSLTITPMLCSVFLGRATSSSKKSISKGLYEKILKKVLLYPKSVLACAVASLLASLFLFSHLPVDLFPEEDRGFFFVYTALPGSPEHRLMQQKHIEGLFQKNEYIENFASIVFPEALLLAVRLVPKESRIPQKKIMAEARKQLDCLPGVHAGVFPRKLINLNTNFATGGEFKLIVQGSSFEEVEKAVKEITKRLRTMSDVTSVDSSFEKEEPFLLMKVDEKRAEYFGIDKKEIQSLLQKTFGKTRAGFLQRGVFREDIIIELLPEYQKNLSAPAALYCTSANGKQIPFKAIASWEEKMGPTTLSKQEGLPSASLWFSLSDQGSINKKLARVEREAAAAITSDSVRASLSDSAKVISSTQVNTLLLFFMATVVMYTILGILYESFIHPLTILSSIPLAGLGGVLTLFVTNEPLSLFSAVGFLLLIGIVKKNGIMMVDYAIEREKDGLSPREAIFEACVVRFRPIMMTTAAAIMGALPIAIGIGESAEMLRGLGLVIVGGLLFSQVLTLFVTPVLYLMFTRNWGQA